MNAIEQFDTTIATSMILLPGIRLTFDLFNVEMLKDDFVSILPLPSKLESRSSDTQQLHNTLASKVPAMEGSISE
jgi:hypothetical protein